MKKRYSVTLTFLALPILVTLVIYFLALISFPLPVPLQTRINVFLVMNHQDCS